MKKIFLILIICISMFYFVMFLNTNNKITSDRKVLVLEINYYSHGECLPGYINYFLELGYSVDVWINEVQSALEPLKLFNDNEKVLTKYLDKDEIITRINSNETDKYNYIFINSEIFYPKGKFDDSKKELIFDNIYKPNLKSKILCVCHRLEDMKRVKQFAIPIVLKSFRKDTNNMVVNPNYFGEIKKHSKNEITNFIVVGNIDKKKRNYDLLTDTVQQLIDNNITDFKVTLVGWEKDYINIPENLAQYFNIKGRLPYPSMYEELQNADYFITLLSPDKIEQNRYKTTSTSGAFQLINGFLIPAIIEKSFADIYGYNNKNAIVYNNNENLYNAMVTAINLDNQSYELIQENLKNHTAKIRKQSIKNLKSILKSFPKYKLSKTYIIFYLKSISEIITSKYNEFNTNLVQKIRNNHNQLTNL